MQLKTLANTCYVLSIIGALAALVVTASGEFLSVIDLALFIVFGVFSVKVKNLLDKNPNL